MSTEMASAIAQNPTLDVKATVALADGTQLDLTSADISLGESKFESATSSESQFDLGACVVGKCSLTLMNWDGHLDKLDFTGATVVPYVGKALSSGTEWLRMGTYTTDDPGTRSGTVTLDCLDALSKLSRPFSDVEVSYPAKPSEIAEAIFAKCGLTVQWDAEPAYDEPIQGAQDNNISCQQAVTYLAQVMGVWVRADEYGTARMGWYDTEKFDTGISWGDVTRQWDDYYISRSAWGYTVPLIDDGESYAPGVTHITAPYSLSASTDDVVITGVTVKAQNEVKTGSDGSETNGADGESYEAGSDGYVLSCTGNPFVAYGSAAAVAKALYSRVVGLRFRPLTVSIPTDPSIEAGDLLICVDRRGNWFQCYATSVTIAPDAASTVRCSAKSAARNSVQGASSTTQAVVQARRELVREMNARELATSDLNRRLSDARGLYDTEETLADGSTIYYMHDKPTISESQIIWKMNANAISVSRDGGKTYATGVTADGDAILNRIYAIGINADYIKTGVLQGNATNFYEDVGMINSGWSGVRYVQNDATYHFWSTERYVYRDAELLDEHIPIEADGIRFNVMVSPDSDPSHIAHMAIRTRNPTTLSDDGWRTSDNALQCGTAQVVDVAIPPGHEVTAVGIDCGSDSNVVKIEYVYVSYYASNKWNLDTGSLFTCDMKAVGINATGEINATGGTIGGFSITNSSIYGQNMVLEDNESPIALYANDASGGHDSVGTIGASYYVQDGSSTIDRDLYGIVFEANQGTTFMSWGYTSKNDNVYRQKFAYYSREVDTNKADTLNAGCDLDMHYHKITNIGGGQTATLKCAVVYGFTSDGHYTYSNDCNLTFTNGILTSFRWPNGQWS